MTFLKYSFRLLLIAVAAIMIWGFVTRVTPAELPELRNGDLVFQTVNTSQTLAIMLASATPYSHVGIVKMDSDGNAVVVEAANPVRELPLGEWIAQGLGGRISIFRRKDLTPGQADDILLAAQPYYGLSYDLWFTFDQNKLYCSELVYYAFRDGAGIDLGKIEKVGDLNIDNPAARRLIEKRWQSHPACMDKADDFESCYPLIMQEELVTPASMAEDPSLELIFTNYGVLS